MKKRRNRNNDSIELQLTPMIDVVFLLLIFFMVTAKFAQPERQIPAFASEEAKGESLALVQEFALRIAKNPEGEVVVVGGSGEGWRLNMLDHIRQELRDYHDRNLVGGALAKDAGVSIQCGDDVKWEAVIRVLDIVREAEIPNIRFR